METKQLEIDCPCCKSRLLIDVRTGKLLRTLRATELDLKGKPVVDERDWGDALGRVKSREEGREGRLDDALSRERGKGARLDELFDKARERLGGEGEDEAGDALPPRRG